MTVLSAQTLRRYSIEGRAIISPLEKASQDSRGNTRGLGPCGVDVTLDVKSYPHETCDHAGNPAARLAPGMFLLISACERFQIPDDVVGIVHDKSSMARRGVAVQNTVLEPGWRGYVTLEITNHGSEILYLRHGDAIAQVIFHRLDEPTELPYVGKYQDQERGPQRARS